MAHAASDVSHRPANIFNQLPSSPTEEQFTIYLIHLTSSKTGIPAPLEQLIKEAAKCKCVFFGEGCRPLFSFLHNDFPSPLEFGGRNYLCATSAYEAQKFLGSPELMQRFTMLDARQAWAFSAEKHRDKTPGWYENRSETMYHVLRAKFGENPNLARLLVSTNDSHLCLHSLHTNMDPFWTNNGDGSGGNVMGNLLMTVRGEKGGQYDVSSPWNYRDLLPVTSSSQTYPPPLNKSDGEIYAEIDDLNRRINDEENKRHTQKARLMENGPLTRFPFNNFPFDKTLVPLSSGRFINANFILGKQYIGTQSPKPNTMQDFWSMVWEHDVPVVIMLNRLGDPGDDIYFPFAMNDKKHYGNIHLEPVQDPVFKTHPTWRQSPHEEEPHAIIYRRIKIWRDGETPRIVHHLQYQNWRDFSAGNERAAAHLVKGATILRRGSPKGPIVVHCHAGVGRTSAAITLLDQVGHLFAGTIDIKRCVERQRSPEDGRCNSMMQSTDQYHFCYRVLRILSQSSLNESMDEMGFTNSKI
jgi:protein tyrosine phosphatase/predicted NAD-dependent protein-ADP-ribosyltransferase YbiA (DUF1768 family)